MQNYYYLLTNRHNDNQCLDIPDISVVMMKKTSANGHIYTHSAIYCVNFSAINPAGLKQYENIW